MKAVTKIDGGWGWVVVAVGIFFGAIKTGAERCFSVFYMDIMLAYDIDYVTVSQVLGLFYVGYAIAGLCASPLIKRFGFRICMMVSGVFTSISCIIASVPGPFWKLVAFYGVFTGFFIGIQVVCMLTAIAHYFDKKLNFASQLQYIGYSIGPFIACPLFQVMIDFFTWNGALMILAGILLNSILAGAVMRPVVQHIILSRKDLECRESETEIENVEVETCSQRLSQQLDLHLFTKLRFYVLILEHTMNYIGISAAFMFLIPFGIEHAGLSRSEAAFLTSAESIGEAMAKIWFMFLFHRVPIRYQKLFICSLYLANTVLFAILPNIQGYTSLLVNCVVIGLMSGGIDGVYSVLCVQIFGQKNVSSLMGYTNAFSMCSCSVVALLVGYIVDVTADLSNAFYFGSITYGIASVLMLLLHFITQTHSQNVLVKRTNT